MGPKERTSGKSNMDLVNCCFYGYLYLLLTSFSVLTDLPSLVLGLMKDSLKADLVVRLLAFNLYNR